MPIQYTPIGVIHSPFPTASDMPIQPAGAADVAGTVEVFEAFREGLADLEGFSHLILLYHLHLSRGFALRVVPFLDREPRGLFATRAPARPNPIGLSVVRLEAIVEGLLQITGVDVIDGTPLLDIKPYVPAFDAPSDVRCGWLEQTGEAVVARRSDDRFRASEPGAGEE
jgi:tRNA-Thr(GGU) m(6)t(6)A37 methyltransferase TsaA